MPTHCTTPPALYLLGLLAALASFACAGGPLKEPPPPPAPAPYAAYVLLVESAESTPVAFARVIVEAGQPCPELLGGEAPIAMSKRTNPNPETFPVDVCEAVVPFEQALTAGEGGPALPAARRRVSRVAVVGDTGCKPQDQSGCGLEDPQWPFPGLARAAAERKPDLVLHMGDFNYRGTLSSFEQTVDGQQVKQWYYDGGDGTEPSEHCGMDETYYSQNSPGNPEADGWQAWWLDFFEPAADLLAAAPWVVARGNHELCSHAGPGWLFFLGPSSRLPEGGGTQQVCPAQGESAPARPHLVFVEPQVIELDGLTVAVLDSANACDELPNYTDTYRGQFGALAGRLDGGGAWLMGHRPVWGVEDTADGPPYGCDSQPGSGPEQPYATMNRTLQCALAGEVGEALLPELDLMLAGHMHRFESLTFEAGSGRPAHLIVGSSGVQEDTKPPTGTFEQRVDGETASGFSVEHFAFLELTKGAAGTWRGAVVTPAAASDWPELPPCGSPAAGEARLCVEPL